MHHPFWKGIDFATVEDAAPPYAPPEMSSDDLMLDTSEMDDEDILQLTSVKRGSTVAEMIMSRGDDTGTKDYSLFLEEGEKLTRSALVLKRKGMWFGKQRMLLLATGGRDGPRVVLVNEETPSKNTAIELLGPVAA